MSKTENLKKVFDFISDYLTEEEIVKEEIKEEKEGKEDFTITESDDNFKRAYTIMKKIDEIDKSNVFVSQRVKETVDPLREVLKKAREDYDNAKNATGRGSVTRVGVTAQGEEVVGIPNIPEDSTLKEVLSNASVTENK